ncbi:MAG TPA: hypothetical protein VI819_04330 [Patescibacteria group bacterium]|nr:hypothetical protein [Patescibacteria group bacterium]
MKNIIYEIKIIYKESKKNLKKFSEDFKAYNELLKNGGMVDDFYSKDRYSKV